MDIRPIENLAHGGASHDPWAQMVLSDGTRVRAHISFDVTTSMPVVWVSSDRDAQVRINDSHRFELRDGQVF